MSLFSLAASVRWALMGTLMLGSLSAAAAQTKPDSTVRPAVPLYRYRLLGIYDEQSGEPIPDVEVADMLSGVKSMTSKTGTMSLFFLPDGGSLVRLRKVGYAVQTIPIAISPADTNPVTIVLARATALPTVVVNESAPKTLTPHLRDFEERQKQGFGHFIDEAEMRKNDNKTLGDALVSHFPGLMMTSSARGGQTLVSSRKMCSGPALRGCRSSNCYPTVFVDGVLANLAAPGQAIDYSHLSPTEYEAAEFYAGGATMPPEYSRTNNDCGVLVLWSRER